MSGRPQVPPVIYLGVLEQAHYRYKKRARRTFSMVKKIVFFVDMTQKS
jgi:hypothetical protein